MSNKSDVFRNTEFKVTVKSIFYKENDGNNTIINYNPSCDYNCPVTKNVQLNHRYNCSTLEPTFYYKLLKVFTATPFPLL